MNSKSRVTRLCSHTRVRVPVGKYTLLLSEFFENTNIYQRPIPDLGVYLYSRWAEHLSGVRLFGTFNHPLPEPKLPYPALVYEWADYGTPSEYLSTIVDYIMEEIQRPSLIEIGCYAGHGRTGTLASIILGLLEHRTATDAILTLRKRYCHLAVETEEQADLVGKFLNSEPDYEALNLSLLPAWRQYLA